MKKSTITKTLPPPNNSRDRKSVRIIERSQNIRFNFVKCAHLHNIVIHLGIFCSCYFKPNWVLDYVFDQRTDHGKYSIFIKTIGILQILPIFLTIQGLLQLDASTSKVFCLYLAFNNLLSSFALNHSEFNNKGFASITVTVIFVISMVSNLIAYMRTALEVALVFMTWTLKVSFRPVPEKEITKEIRIEPSAYLFKALVEVSNIFDINDPHNHVFLHKKRVLSLLSNAKESGLSQGSSIYLVRSGKFQSSSTVCFNYKLFLDGGVQKIIESYPASSNFVSCLQKVGPNKLDVLRHDRKLPEISVLSGKLSSDDLIVLDKFSLDALGMSGNYLISVTYLEISTSIVTISEAQNSARAAEKKELKLNTVAEIINIDVKSAIELYDNPSDHEFEIIHPKDTPEPIPDLPDSFYDLTREDLISYQKSIQRQASSRSSESNDSRAGLLDAVKIDKIIPIKLTFPDKMQVLVSFRSNTTAQAIIEFIRRKIIDTHESEIELWTGSPCSPIKLLGKSLASLGINGPTKIFVKCGIFNYRKN